VFEVNSRNGEWHTFPSTTEVRGTFYVYENVVKVMRIHARKLLLVAMSREPEKGVGAGEWGRGEKLRESIYAHMTKKQNTRETVIYIHELCRRHVCKCLVNQSEEFKVKRKADRGGQQKGRRKREGKKIFLRSKSRDDTFCTCRNISELHPT